MVLPSLAELLDVARIVAIPTRTRFRGISIREAALFIGPNGATEFSPFPEYDDAEAAQWLAAAVEFGWGEVPTPRRERITVNATVPAVGVDEVRGILERFPGCTTAKVKVAERGQTLADDIARVRAVRRLLDEAAGAEARVRVDANAGWSTLEAVMALTTLAEFNLDYAEQPCATVEELAEVRERLNGAVRIAADESVRKADDPLAVARANAADLLVVKAQPLGGIAPALGIIEAAELPVVVSSALDTSVGISMGLHLAAALPDGVLTGACGLGTVPLLDGDVVALSLVPEGGSIPVERPYLDGDLLARYRAAPDREVWWRERIARCHALLAAESLVQSPA
ncbi:MAG: o-succinylbenzoate synthase [Leucobacter sp.]